MSESEKMDLILSEVQSISSHLKDMKSDMQNMNSDIQNIKFDIQSMKSDIQNIKFDIQSMKSDIQNLQQRMTSLELHIENGTDRNIQLLAENFIELTKKLNQAIPVADKNLAYEVKVNYLLEEFEKLKLTVTQLKNQFAS